MAQNKQGLPDNSKGGIENLSGHSMDDVKAHFNLRNPAQLQALAHAQGTEIHLQQNQQTHLPHEAAHVLQQKMATPPPQQSQVVKPVVPPFPKKL